MDRLIAYMGQIPLDIMFLIPDKNAMISDGWVAQGVLGTATLFSGLPCSPTSPATMTVNVGGGCVYAQENIDNSAYGSLNSDTTHQIVKIGINPGTLNFACPAPATTGQSVVYLVEAAFVEEDTGATVLPYYNAANPATPWSGPSNTGVSQNTVRQNICSVQVKAGVPATTGTQATPAPDAGYTGLYAVTVANGQMTITSGNIQTLSGAPFIAETLTQKISQTTADSRYAQITAVQNNSLESGIDSSGTANTITINLSPAPTALVQNMTIVVTVANNNTGPTTLNVNGLGAKSVTRNGNALTGGEMLAGQNYQFSYNGTSWNMLSPPANASQIYEGTAATTGTANAQILAAVTPAGFSLTYGVVVTFTAGNTNTGATMLDVDSSGVITIKKKGSSGGLVDLAAGDLTSTEIYQVIYDGTYWELNSQSFPPASTFFQVANDLSEGTPATMRSNLGLGSAALLNTSQVLQSGNNLSDVPTPATALANLGIAQPEGGITHGRLCKWTSNTTYNVSAASVVMKNSTGQTVKVSNPSDTLNSATLGAGGIDVGTIAANEEYWIYGIYNETGATWKPIMSLSDSGPSFANASGYAYQAIVGFAQTDGNGHFIGINTIGNECFFQVGSNLSTYPVAASGLQGSFSGGVATYAAASLAGIVPSLATKVRVLLATLSDGVDLAVAPNSNFGFASGTTVVQPLPPLMIGTPSSGATTNLAVEGTIDLESTDLYYLCVGTGASYVNSLSIKSFTLNI